VQASGIVVGVDTGVLEEQGSAAAAAAKTARMRANGFMIGNGEF
jgi:hypothetical protein